MPELLRAESLSKTYIQGRRHVPALQEVSLSLERGETLGLVGESGCGKTTLGRVLLRLYPPDRGRILFDGQLFFDAALKKQPDDSALRRRMQMIFQDPGASLDPRKTVEQTLAQALRIHRLHQGRRGDRIKALLSQVGLSAGQMDAYPHQLSGGQQQRVAIARALSTEPDFLVCDEPVSALDLSIQAQILALLRDLQETGLAFLFIGHDLSVVRQVSHRIAVMYGGRLVEEAPCEALIGGALHPYTKALLLAVPTPGRTAFPRALPMREEVPGGCPYLPCCPRAEAVCRAEVPALRTVASGHLAACHLL